MLIGILTSFPIREPDKTLLTQPDSQLPRRSLQVGAVRRVATRCSSSVGMSKAIRPVDCDDLSIPSATLIGIR